MLMEFWGEAVVTAVYLQNRLPMKSLAGRTPYEAWHGRKPAVNHLCVFDCRAFVKQLGHVDKLIDRSCAGVFIGYAEGAKAYRILDPAALQVCTARNVVFDEAHGWDWTATTGAPPTAEFIVEYIYAGASEAAAEATGIVACLEFTNTKCQDVGCTALNTSRHAKSTVGSSVSCGPCSTVARICDTTGKR
jgi:hypothetical protein